MRVMVTGGCGFIGSHLVERLIAGGNEVVVLDDMSTGKYVNPDAETHEHDISLPLPWLGKFDWMMNLACPASPKAYQADPIQTWKSSVIGTMNVIDYLRANCPRARFFQASTSEIYGDPLQHPQREEYWGNVNPRGVRSCYDEGKRAAESFIADCQRSFGLDARVARIFNTYGPRLAHDDGRVVSNFIVQGLCGEPLTIYGDGSQTRSFCYVDDLVEGFMRLMTVGPAVPVNLGNPGEFTMLELAKSVRELTGWKSSLVMKPLPADDPTRRCPDISLAKETLGWSPSINLRTGLERTIEWFKGELGAG